MAFLKGLGSIYSGEKGTFEDHQFSLNMISMVVQGHLINSLETDSVGTISKMVMVGHLD
jgi:hypothetical protein